MNLGIKFFAHGIIFFMCVISGAFFYSMHHMVIDFSSLAHYDPGQPTILLDDQGKEWARFSYDKREPLTLDCMPSHLMGAFIAAEDWNFYTHAGVSYKGIIRSALVNLINRRAVQGASTITQQLVKLLFTDGKRTFARKLKEQYYSILVEQQFTKDYIMQTYLNHVYFGCGIYGVQAACQRFWAIHVDEISIAQAATLAGIVRSPAHYCPLLHPQSALSRRNLILGIMKKLGIISQEEYEKARNSELILKAADESTMALHWKEAIRMFLEEQFGKEQLYNGGLIVQTTLNRQAQEHAQNSLKKVIPELRTVLKKPVDGALLSVDPKTGAIKAMVGGYNYSTSKFNRALQARRQMGSIFKPLIYINALEKGCTFRDIFLDEPIDVMINNALWQPHNYNNQHEGSMTLARALIRSNNIITIKVLASIGYDRLLQMASDCKLPALQPYPSLALGCIDVTLKEAAGMFSIFANGGMYHEPYMVSWIKDKYGRKIWKSSRRPKRVCQAHIVGQVSKVLEFGITKMRTVFKSPLVDSDVICKTGTTNESRTCWFAGATPELVTISYIGCDDNQSLGDNVFPLRTAFPLWLGLHENLHPVQKSFSYDVKLKECTIDQWSGKLTTSSDKNAIHIMTT